MRYLKRRKRKMASYKPTAGMVAEAKKGLAWRREHGRGGTSVGIARARDIVNGKSLSESTVKRMFSFFSRHEVDKKAEGFRPAEKGYPSNGRIAWALWGGDAGFSWSRKITNQLKNEDERAKETRDPISGAMRKALENKAKDHNEKHGGDKRKKTNVRTLSAVFRRGVGAYKTNPQSVRPTVNSPEQWALARVNSFLYCLRNLKFRSGKHDTDLLPSAHPLSSKRNDGRIANMDNAERHIKDVRETEDSYIIEFGKSMPEEDDMEENSYHDEEEKAHHDEEERSADIDEELSKEEIDQIAEDEYVAQESNEDVLRFYAEENLQRAFEFDRTKIDEENRTIMIGVSSEEPVERRFGMEVLGHSEGEIDMEFMASGRSPLLLDHDATKQIGVVEEFGLDHANKRTIAKVRFSKNKQADEVFRDVVDGIRQNISVGYEVKSMRKESDKDGDVSTYRVDSWSPLEVSAVSIPADQSRLVGFARSKETTLINNPKEDKTMSENVDNKVEVSSDAMRADIAKENAAIIDLAVKHGKRDLAENAISQGMSLPQFRGHLLDTIANDKPLDLPSSVDMNETEQRSYSLLKAVSEAAQGKLSGLEKEVSDEIAQRTGKEARGFYMPTNIAFRADQVVGTNNVGGFLKPTDHLGDEFIEALKARLVVGQAGARVLQGLKGDVAIPKMSAETSNVSFVAENSAPSEGNATFAQVTMSPKTLACQLDISRKLMLQSDPSIEAVLRNDVINSFARKIDEVALEGGGSNEPSGIIASSTGNVVAIGTNGGAISYAKCVDMVEAVEVDNAILNDASVKFVGNPKVTANLRTISKQSSGVEGNFILGEDNRILGYDYMSSTLVPSDLTKGTGTNLSALIFGDFSQLMLGFYSGVDVIVDPYTGSNAGTTRLAFFQDFDVALRHDDSFSVIKDITT
jgi:HK97 family phage major capsid protein